MLLLKQAASQAFLSSLGLFKLVPEALIKKNSRNELGGGSSVKAKVMLSVPAEARTAEMEKHRQY